MKKQVTGLSLLELLMVSVMVSFLLVMAMGYMQQKIAKQRQDRTVMQMQSVINAALAYYIQNGKWPANGVINASHALVVDGFLPNSSLASPWAGAQYTTYFSNSPTALSRFYVYVLVGNSTNAIVAANGMAAQLPLGFTSKDAGPPPSAGAACNVSSPETCYLVGSVNVPARVLNNATSVTFAGLYHHGGCIPVPTCAVDTNTTTMKPQVFIIPISVSGVNDTGNTSVYPISSFTSYASSGTPQTLPDPCTVSDTAVACGNTTDPAGQLYWRACLQVITERGEVAVTNTATDDSSWGQYVTLAAFTRCAINNERSGSDFSVYTH